MSSEAIASWENPRPPRAVREYEPRPQQKTVELSLIVETNESDAELMRKIEGWLVGPVDEADVSRSRARMGKWLRRVEVETIFDGVEDD